MFEKLGLIFSGIIYGFGNGLILTMVNIFMTQHFDKYRAVAFGVVYAGSTVGRVDNLHLFDVCINSIDSGLE